MPATPSPARTPADHTHWCPGGCQRRVPNRLFACGDCWVRLPFRYQQPISANYRRDHDKHAEAMAAAVQWYADNPVGTPPELQKPGPTLAETLQDLSDMLAGIGRHADHVRTIAGRCTVCSCGVRVQGRPS